VIALINLFVGAVALTVGLLLLLVVQTLPLWAFAVLIAMTNALIVPIGAFAHIYLYGDAVHAESTTDNARPGTGPERALSTS
jgi:hypothetical protein